MNNQLKNFLVFALILLLVPVIYILFYTYNNKFTYNTIQTENGVLNLTESFYSNPIIFLTGEWEYYRDAQTPDDLNNLDMPAGYVAAAQYSDLTVFQNIGNSSDGLFRMVIRTGRQDNLKYMIEVPELKCSYKLWVNGILEINFDSESQNIPHDTISRFTAFRASEEIELIFYLSDIYNMHEGVVTPATFGLSGRVIRYMTFSFLITCIFCFVSMGISFLYILSLRWTKNRSITLVIILLCFSLAGISSYPIIQLTASGHRTLWFAVENFLYDIVIFVVIYLQSKISNYKFKFSTLFTCLSLFFAALTLFVPLIQTNYDTLYAVYTVLEIVFKISIALYLLLYSAFSILTERASFKFMAYGVFIFALSIPIDIFFIKYDPIYIGLPYQLGILGFTAIFTFHIGQEPLELYAANQDALLENYVLAENSKILNSQLHLQENQYKLMAEYIEKARALRHDLHHHMYVLKSYADAGNTDQITKYLQESIQNLDFEKTLKYCKNIALNAIVSFHADNCINSGIEFLAHIDIDEDIPINSYDLCIIFGNCLENAYEACCRMSGGHQYIHVRTRIQGILLTVRIENSYDGITERVDEKFISRKEKRDGFLADKSHTKIRGIGTASIQAVAQKYSGSVEFEYDEHTFGVLILLKLDGVINLI